MNENDKLFLQIEEIFSKKKLKGNLDFFAHFLLLFKWLCVCVLGRLGRLLGVP